MSLFVILASALVLLTILVLAWTLWRGDSAETADTDLVASNIAIARERLAALDQEHAGDTDNAEYREERARIEAQLARELKAGARSTRSRLADGGLIAALVLVVPATSAWLYTQIGTPAAIDGSNQPQTADAGPSLPELVAGLESRLAESPTDVTGWRMLGRTRFAMTDFELAANAFAVALDLEPDDVDTLTHLAEARAMMEEGDLSSDKAVALLERAQAINANHEQSLWLLGVARQQGGRHQEALVLFSRLRAMLSARNEVGALTTVDEFIARSQEIVGTVAPNLPAQTDSEADNDASEAAAPASLTVKVELGEEAASTLAPDTAVFVFARAAEGPPMPLAVQRLTVADLPTSVVLDESMAMIPNLTLGSFSELIVGARASLSGQPIASSGDWSVETRATLGSDGSATSPVQLTIETRLP